MSDQDPIAAIVSHPQTTHYSLDAAALTTLGGTVFGYLPTLAYIVPVFWYALQVYTWFQDQGARKRARGALLEAATTAANKLIADAVVLATAKLAEASVAATVVTATAKVVAEAVPVAAALSANQEHTS